MRDFKRTNLIKGYRFPSYSSICNSLIHIHTNHIHIFIPAYIHAILGMQFKVLISGIRSQSYFYP